MQNVNETVKHTAINLYNHLSIIYKFWTRLKIF
jgi:hypothetical protein